MTATHDDHDLEAWADRPTAGTGGTAPQGAWFSVAGTGDPGVLGPEAFTQGGAADRMEPGALLAALAEGVLDPAGLGLVSDNALLGVVGASRRLMSRAAAMSQRAVAEYARRHQAAPGGRRSRAGYTEFSSDDLAPELVVNASQAEAAMLRHEASLRRLPACSQALWDGQIGEYPMKIIVDATACLDDAGAAEADQILAREAPGLTPGQLRVLAARVVLMIDPDAAEERRRDAAARARIVKYREDAGTAALSGRDLPPDAVLRSWQHIDAAARILAASGIKAGLDKLRAAVYLGLTSGTDPVAVLPLLQETPGDRLTPEPAASAEPGDDDGRDQDGDGDGGTRRDGPGPGPGGPASPVAGPVAPFQAVINLLVPLGTAFGWSSAPGEIPGWGPLDPETTTDMMAAASRHPLTRWCVTLTGPDGTAAAHGCAPGRHPWAPPRASDPNLRRSGGGNRDGPSLPWDREPDGTVPGAGGQRQEAGQRQQAAQFLASLRTRMAQVANGIACDHAECTGKYEVPRRLKHLIRARTATCTAPCCNQPAADGDADHTIPWPEGPTCQENLGTPCRYHHRCKQAPGWTLRQPRPGTFQWTGPSGRVRTTQPTRYLARKPPSC
jgi:hypothetical protein